MPRRASRIAESQSPASTRQRRQSTVTREQESEDDVGLRPRPGRWVNVSSSRVQMVRYDSGLQQVQVIFRDGTPWVYDEVPRSIWNNFRRSSSPGRYINRVLNGYPYYRGAFDFSSIFDAETEYTS